MMENDQNNLFSDMSYGGPHINLDRIEWSIQSIENFGLFEEVWYVGDRELPASLQSRKVESVFWDSRSHAPALLTEPELAEAILGFPRICPNIIELSVVTNWLGLGMCGLVRQGYLPPIDSWHRAVRSRPFSSGLHMPIKHRFID